jgi:hypothetical protein
LWRYLTRWNNLDYKGPSVSALVNQLLEILTPAEREDLKRRLAAKE